MVRSDNKSTPAARAIVQGGVVVRQEASERAARVKGANKVLAEIAKHGTRLFWSEQHVRSGKFAVDDKKYARVHFIDPQTEAKMALYGSGAWPGFSHGPEEQMLVKRLGKYVATGQQIDAFQLSAAVLSNYDAGALDVIRRIAVRAKVLLAPQAPAAPKVPTHHRPAVVERAKAALAILGKGKMTEKHLMDALETSKFTIRNVLQYLRDENKIYVASHTRHPNHYEKVYAAGNRPDVER